jgi:hypothetical protein
MDLMVVGGVCRSSRVPFVGPILTGRLYLEVQTSCRFCGSFAGKILICYRLVEEDQTTHVNTNYVIKSDDGAYLYIR